MGKISRRSVLKHMGAGLAGVVLLGDTLCAREDKEVKSFFNSDSHPFSANGLKISYDSREGGDDFMVYHSTEKGERAVIGDYPSVGIANGLENGRYRVRVSPGYHTGERYGKMKLLFEEGTKHGDLDVRSNREEVKIMANDGEVEVHRKQGWNRPHVCIEKYGFVQSGNLAIDAKERGNSSGFTEIHLDLDYLENGRKGATSLEVQFLGVPYSFIFNPDGTMKAVKRTFSPGESPKFLRKYSLPF